MRYSPSDRFTLTVTTWNPASQSTPQDVQTWPLFRSLEQAVLKQAEQMDVSLVGVARVLHRSRPWDSVVLKNEDPIQPAVIVVTHDQRTLEVFGTIYEMEDGVIHQLNTSLSSFASTIESKSDD